jgi:hypothetical protein
MAVLGGHHYEDADYVVAHLWAGEVPQVAAALETVDENWMRQRYDRIDPTDYQGLLSGEDFTYTWGWFKQVRDFYRQAAAANRAVIFTVDQQPCRISPCTAAWEHVQRARNLDILICRSCAAPGIVVTLGSCFSAPRAAL